MYIDREITAPLPEHRKFTFMTPAYCIFFLVLHQKIKSGQTYNTRMLPGLKLWQKVSGNRRKISFSFARATKRPHWSMGNSCPGTEESVVEVPVVPDNS